LSDDAGTRLTNAVDVHAHFLTPRLRQAPCWNSSDRIDSSMAATTLSPPTGLWADSRRCWRLATYSTTQRSGCWCRATPTSSSAARIG